MIQMHGQIAVVTGAGQGIGRAIADRLLERGATVYYTDARSDALSDVAAKGPNARLARLDVTSEDDWASLVGDLESSAGHVDILVNNAGIDMMQPIAQITLESWNRVMTINVAGVFLGVRALIPLLAAASPRRDGGASIVNISSIMGQTGLAECSTYCASKGAVTVLTKSLALELADRGIRVNSVHPGMIRGPMLEHGAARAVAAGKVADTKDFADVLAGMSPLRRTGKPEEVAAAVAFLASSDASFVTGAELNVDGGYAAI